MSELPELQKEALGKSIAEIIPNVIIWGIVCVVFFFIGQKWPIIGKIAFFVFLVMAIIDLIKILFQFITGLILVFASKEEKGNQKIAWITNFIQTIETAIFVGYTWFLYLRFIK